MKLFTKRKVQFLIGAILIAILTYWIDIEQVRTSFKQANIYYLFFALLLTIANRIFMPVKWRSLLNAKGINLPLFYIIKIYFISSFLGIFLPPTVGADSTRAYYIHKKGYSLSDTVSSIVVERILGLIALFLVGFVGCIILINYFSVLTFDFEKFLLLVITLGIIVIFGFFLSINETFGHLVKHFLNRLKGPKIVGKIAKLIENFYDSYLEYREKKLILFIFFILTCIEVLLPIIRSYIIATALNADVSFLYFLSFVPIILLLIRLPISFDGFGIQEGGFVYFLSIVGISTAVGFNIGIINHIIFLTALLPGGIFYIFHKDTSDQKIAEVEAH